MEPIESIQELVLGKRKEDTTKDDDFIGGGGNDDYDDDDIVMAKDLELVKRLEELYGGDIERVDAYIGTLFEKPDDPTNDRLGPIHTMSIRDQFNRVRDGDRFWYENIFTEEERLMFPSLEDIIKEVGTGMEKFPSDAFVVKTKETEGTCSEEPDNNKVILLG